MDEDFRPKIEFDDSSLSHNVAAKATLDYATPRSEARRRWRPSRLFSVTTGISGAVNLAIYFCIFFSGNDPRSPLWLLFALANLPAVPLLFWLLAIFERNGVNPTSFDLLLTILYGSLGAVLWGMIAVVVAKFFRSCLTAVVWLFGDAWRHAVLPRERQVPHFATRDDAAHYGLCGLHTFVGVL